MALASKSMRLGLGLEVAWPWHWPRSDLALALASNIVFSNPSLGSRYARRQTDTQTDTDRQTDCNTPLSYWGRVKMPFSIVLPIVEEFRYAYVQTGTDSGSV